MTLCIAWRTKNNINFSSDSRLTFKSSKKEEYSDIGIKVFSVPVKIYSSIDSVTNSQTLDYDYNLGLCFAGQTMNAYIVKETVYEVLQRLQYTTFTDYSMEGIVSLVNKFYEHTSRKLCEILRDRGLAEFFLTGYCPKDKELKAFKFFLDTTEFPICAKTKRILTNSEVEFLGSGSKSASDILDENPKINKFQLLKKVIKDEKIPSVGGNIQYGNFDVNNSFSIKGVEDYEETNEVYPIRRKLLLRGTELYDQDIKLNYKDFHISYTFIRPFEDEIEKLFNKNLFDQ